MTHVFTDFITQISPAGHPPFPEGDAAGDQPYDTPSCFDSARHRHRRWLAALNRQVARHAQGGYLIAAPLCPTVCSDGPEARFLLDIGIDPFGRWNMMLFANNDPTADLFNTLAYDLVFRRSLDEIICAYIKQLQTGWHEGASVSSVRSGLTVNARRMEDMIMSSRRDVNSRHAAQAQLLVPPKAEIRSRISPGKGAANSMSRS